MLKVVVEESAEKALVSSRMVTFMDFYQFLTFTTLLFNQFVTDDARYLLLEINDPGVRLANDSKGLYDN